MQTLNTTTMWPVTALVVLAAISDLRTRRIPNALTIAFLIAGLLTSSISGGWHGLSQSLLGVLLSLLILGVFCLLGGMGMGDMKLCAAVGSWIGPAQMGVALVFTGIAGGLIGLIWAAQGGFLIHTLRTTGRLLLLPVRHDDAPASVRLTINNPATRKLPYAPAIAIGTFCSFWAGR